LRFLLFPICSPHTSRLASCWIFLLATDTLALLMLVSPDHKLWAIGLFVAIRAMLLRNLDLARPSLPNASAATQVAARFPESGSSLASGMGGAVVHGVTVMVTFGLLWQFVLTDVVWASFPTQSHYYAETAAVIDGWVEQI